MFSITIDEVSIHRDRILVFNELFGFHCVLQDLIDFQKFYMFSHGF